MKSLKCYMVMAGVLTAILSGCENKNVETSQPVEAAKEVTKETENERWLDRSPRVITARVSDEELARLEDDLVWLEAFSGDFEKATDLSRDAAISFAFGCEYRNVFEKNPEKSLFWNYGLTEVKWDDKFELPIKLVSDLLVKYFGEGDVDKYEEGGNSDWLFEKVSFLPSGEKVMFEFNGHPGGFPVRVNSIFPDFESDGYVVLADELWGWENAMTEYEVEDERYKYYGVGHGKKKQVNCWLGDIIEQREYKLGKNKDGGFYFKSQKTLWKNKRYEKYQEIGRRCGEIINEADKRADETNDAEKKKEIIEKANRERRKLEDDFNKEIGWED